jgi:hypothetical protein
MYISSQLNCISVSLDVIAECKFGIGQEFERNTGIGAMLMQTCQQATCRVLGECVCFGVVEQMLVVTVRNCDGGNYIVHVQFV